MTFDAMAELIKPVIVSGVEFDKFVEDLMNEGRASIKPKERPDSEVVIVMIQSS